MANNAIQVKRTNVSGRQPNTTGSYSTNSQYISAGELALNMADGILYTSNGSAVIPIGSNNINVNVTGNLTVNNIVANNSNGAPGTVLTSNGSSVYWGTSTTSGLSVYSINGEGGSLNSTVNNVTGIQFDYNTGFHVTDEGSGNVFVSLGSGFKTIQVAGQTSITAVGEDTLVIANGAGITLSTSNSAPKTLTISSTGGGTGTVTEIDSGNGLSGGPITTSGTLSVLANTGIVANSSGTFVNPTYVGTQTANNTNFVGSISAANVVSNAQLQANLSNYITNSTAYSTFATNSYVNSTFATNSYVNSTFATNSYVNSTFATNSYVNSTFATNSYVNSTFAPLSGATFTGVVNHNANVIIDFYGTSSLKVGTNFVANSSGISTSNATFSALTIANNLTVTGNLTISGNTVIVGSNNLIVQDSVISVHTQANLAPWTTDDGLNIGLALHYYDTSDKQGFLGRENSTGRLVWYDTSTDVIGGSVSGNTLGTMQANQFWVGNGSVYSTVNSTVFTGTANNASYLNNKTEANLNVNSAITSNSANNSSYLNNKTEANLNVNNALTANSSSYLGSAAAASYVQNTDSRTLSGNLNFTGTNTYFSGKTTFNANANFNTNIFLNSGLAIIDSTGSQGTVGQVLASNGAGNIYWTSASINSNNASYLGGVAAASYVQNTDSRTLSGNLNFTGTNVTFGSTISANINGNANNSSYLGTVAAASYVQNTDSRTLSGNLNFTGTNVTFGSVVSANINGNANNSSYLGTVAAASYVQNTDSRTLSGNLNFTGTNVTFGSTISANINGNANNSSYLGTVAAASYVQNTDSRTLSGNLNFTGTNVYFTTINFGAVATGTGGNITNSSIVFLGNNTVNAYLNTIGLNVNNSTIANTTGVYTSIVNAASHTVGTNFIANTSQITISSIPLSSNGSTGTSGQVLTSNGSTGAPYWATAAFSNAISSSFTANGSQTTFTLGISVRNQNNSIVTLDGMVQVPVTHYSISGTTLTMTTAPIANSIVEVRNFDNIIAGGSSGVSTGKAIAMAIVFGG